MTERVIASQRRKSGVARGSITRLHKKVQDLQNRPDSESAETLAHCHRISDKLKELDTEFKTQHLSLTELLEDEADLEREQ